MKDNNVVFKDFYLILFGIPVLSFIIPPVFFHHPIENTKHFWTSVFISMIFTTVDWTICRFIIIKINGKFPKISENNKRLGWIFFICSAVVLGLCSIINSAIGLFIDTRDIYEPSLFLKNAISYLLFIAITSMYEAMRYLQLWQNTIVEKEALAKANLQSQLESLKNQVNPHFLFNSLNTLIQLIPEHPDNAVRFVHQMSKVYRYILEIKESDTTSLENELKFLIAYAFLLKERFGNNLKVQLADMEAYYNLQIIPLALQIVLENAIKHNIISTEKPLTIEIFVENDDKLVVRNNLQRKNQVQIGTGTGLENINNRYALLSDRKMEVMVTPQYFTVVLPLLV